MPETMPSTASTSPVASASPQRRGLLARAVGVVVAPRATFGEVAAKPGWAGVLGLVVGVVIVSTFTLLSTEVGRGALLDQQIRTLESFGVKINDAQYALMEQRLGVAPYFSAVSQLVFLPLVAVVISAMAIGVFGALLGGDATFRQVFSVVSHSGVIIGLQNLFSMPLDYARETLTSPTNLAVFLPFLDENTFVSRLFGSIDLFVVWWTITLAIGLGVLYRRRTAPIAVTMLALYAVLAIVISAVRTVLSGA